MFKDHDTRCCWSQGKRVLQEYLFARRWRSCSRHTTVYCSHVLQASCRLSNKECCWGWSRPPVAQLWSKDLSPRWKQNKKRQRLTAGPRWKGACSVFAIDSRVNREPEQVQVTTVYRPSFILVAGSDHRVRTSCQPGLAGHSLVRVLCTLLQGSQAWRRTGNIMSGRNTGMTASSSAFRDCVWCQCLRPADVCVCVWSGMTCCRSSYSGSPQPLLQCVCCCLWGPQWLLLCVCCLWGPQWLLLCVCCLWGPQWLLLCVCCLWGPQWLLLCVCCLWGPQWLLQCVGSSQPLLQSTALGPYLERTHLWKCAAVSGPSVALPVGTTQANSMLS